MKRLILLFTILLAAAALEAQSPPPAGLLAQGERSFNSDDFSGALLAFQKILSDPARRSEHPAATFWMGKTYFSLQDIASAEKYIENFLASWPGHPLEAEAIYTKGRILLVQGDYENSILLLGKFLETTRENSLTPHALFWVAEASLQLGRREEATRLFTRLIEAYPKNSKLEAAKYRLSLLDMKNREEELLRLLQWTQEESVTALEAFQRREKAYQQALAGYQSKLGTTDAAGSARIASLEAQVASLQGSQGSQTTTGNASEDLLRLKVQALELKIFYAEWEKSHGK